MSQSGVQWFREHAAGFSGQLAFDEPLSKYTYYRIGGPVALLAIPKSVDDVRWLAEGIRATGVPYFVLGAGSNLLVSDSGYPGLVVRAARLNLDVQPLAPPEASAAFRLRTGSGVAVSSLLRRAAQEGWRGLEFLAGVPGSIGGVVTMNAGTHLGEAKDRLRKVEVLSLLGGSGELVTYEGDALRYRYRRNEYLPTGSLVWAAEWELTFDTPVAVKAVIDETLSRRKSTQPVDYPSCGSVFKNPRESGRSAWQVVDELGLRGHRIGNAQFAEKHSNFIINLGGARAEDVRALIELAKARASERLGIALEEEVIYLGAFAYSA